MVVMSEFEIKSKHSTTKMKIEDDEDENSTLDLEQKIDMPMNKYDRIIEKWHGNAKQQRLL